MLTGIVRDCGATDKKIKPISRQVNGEVENKRQGRRQQMESKGTEDNCTFHPVTSRAAHINGGIFTPRHTCVRVRTCTPASVSSEKSRWPFELLIVFLQPDRLNTLKYTQLAPAQNHKNTASDVFYACGMFELEVGRIGRQQLLFLPPFPPFFAVRFSLLSWSQNSNTLSSVPTSPHQCCERMKGRGLIWSDCFCSVPNVPTYFLVFK